MSQEIINTMRNLREDMRQRLVLLPEYRALAALDRSIDEICTIMRDGLAPHAAAHPALAEPVAALEPTQAPIESLIQPAATERQGGIANAFAETLAAKMDQRSGPRPMPPYQLPARAVG